MLPMQDKGEPAVGCYLQGARYADLKARGVLPMPVLWHTPLQAARLHDQVDRAAGGYAVQVGAS